MNQNIEKLYKIASKSQRFIIGLMSGTSMDGLDIALCKIQNAGTNTKVELVEFESVGFHTNFKEEVKKIFAKREIDFQHLCVLNPWIGIEHGKMILECLKKWKLTPNDIDLIASHGQTVFHAPKRLHELEKFGNATLQIGDGDHLAVTTNIITISDFRQKHIAAGGEGAPLAVYGDYLIFSTEDENRIMLNIGGIANFTYLPAHRDPKLVFSTDVGTGNTLIDAFVQKHFPGKYFDENAELARKGMVNFALLKELKSNDFFNQSFPKTTGPELFGLNYLQTAQINSNTGSISNEDVLATLTKFSADGITDAINKCFTKQEELHVYLSGGGMHNPLMVEFIKQELPNCKFHTTDDLAIKPDAKEAVLFAILANETVAGSGDAFGNKERGIPAVTMGKISFPN
ncbi:anhydro-N-acetylmuramic acid kinase [Solitalea koreensis]|uniref:Anhydro-N-acetylmuramic acid kinase n=1 Tax=Solitalea koreensis TaxID=543615 RepID=A0A521B0L7_9SPHI|nr:anhydro-N-acetylmuramic acid kinase [Solitalea koreensis]SMO40643.1 anhydro-N-acetylmuramic acid kinase [Solitalea koreensis]